MTDRWALYLDVEGFGSKWNETDMAAFRGINELMEGIFRIGSRHYVDTPSRLFAHQFGDGFLIVSDFHEEMLDRAVLVGVALMRQLLAVGETAKCALDEGQISDIANCNPDSIRKQYNRGRIGVGAGLMTITPVMGTALIRTVNLQKKVRGPVFLLRKVLAGRISLGFPLREVGGTDLVSLNWLRGDPPALAELQEVAGLKRLNETERIGQLSRYVECSPGLSAAWLESAQTYLLAHGA
jgi:hypothetical protein